MRHSNSGKKLGRTPSHRKALFRNMASAMITYGKIRTTEVKAKELRRVVEPLITLALRNDLHSRRLAYETLNDHKLVQRLFDVVAPLFAGVPGLKVACASTAADAKGLLKSAIRDNDPVLFLEETAAYRMKEEVPIDPDFLVPIGKSKVVCEGNDLTVVSFGTAALKATKAIPLLEENGIHIQLIDLRSLRPLDLDPVIESVKRTGKLLVVDEYTETYGISGEIAFQVTEKCFSELKMPVQRCTLPETIIPAGPVMEDWVMLSPQKIADRVKEIVGG